MKKNHLILVALATISTINSIHAASKAEESTEAVLDNNFHKVKSNARRLSQEELSMLLGVAKQKNAFYRTRVKRWQMANKFAIAGVPLSVILGIVAGMIGGAKLKIEYAKWTTPPVMVSKQPYKTTLPSDQELGAAIEGVIVGAPIGAPAGAIASVSLLAWTNKNINKWQKELDTSNRIVDWLQEKIESVQK